MDNLRAGSISRIGREEAALPRRRRTSHGIRCLIVEPTVVVEPPAVARARGCFARVAGRTTVTAGDVQVSQSAGFFSRIHTYPVPGPRGAEP